MQLLKVSPWELEKAAWFPELSSGSKPAAPGSPAQRRGSIAESRNSPRAPPLESGSRMGLARSCCLESPCPQGCAPRDGAVWGHPFTPHPAGVPAIPVPRRCSWTLRFLRQLHWPMLLLAGSVGPRWQQWWGCPLRWGLGELAGEESQARLSA